MDNSDKTRTSSHDSWVVWDLNGYLDGISLIKNEMANVEPEESAKHYFEDKPAMIGMLCREYFVTECWRTSMI